MPDDVSTRLSGTSYAVLGLIAAWGPCTPYDLKRAIETTVENFWPVPHTTFYVEPARLAEAGLLTVDQEEGGRRRKLYAVTAAGRRALDAWVAEPSAAPPQLRDELVLKVFLGADPGPLTAERVAWHQAKLAELEGYLELVRAGEGTAGMDNALVAGREYHRALIGMLERLTGA
jgi:PadR family transcriptional regulator, regulatory protein AphA